VELSPLAGKLAIEFPGNMADNTPYVDYSLFDE
jgi:hypothetical protein